MRVDVFFGASSMTSADVHGRLVVVIDVLRASSTIAVALANGARSVIPFESAEEAITRSKSFARGEYRLAGERKNLMIPGFDLGNSPRDFTREQVEGKSILFTTTNGTAALVAVQGAREIIVGAFVNFTAVLSMMRAAARASTDIAILAAGSDRHFSLEDATCAGRFVRMTTQRVPGAVLNDGAVAAVLLHKKYGGDIAKLFAEATHGRVLRDAGFAEDLVVCGEVDSYPVVPVYQDRQITKLGPERER
ncbi:MAG: 2-phosphosulfolactate phosphatase [Gemmatimonadaceae bacterium]